MKRFSHAYTIIELAFVVVVIGVLISVVLVNYQGVQVRARDAKLADASDKVQDAIQLFVANKGHFPRGSWGSTTAIGAGTECADGNGSGWFSPGIYACSISETLVASQYLPSRFDENLPQNPLYPSDPQRQSIMVYITNATTRIAMVFYSMESPSTKDTANFNAELTKCGFIPTDPIAQRDTYGMRNGMCFNY